MRRHISTLYIVAAVILTVVVGLMGFIPLGVRWLLIIAVFVALLVLIGREVTGQTLETTRRGPRFVPGRADGVLIDLRNKVSLSRLQLTLWTIVILSAWVTLALHRTIPVLQGQLATTQNVTATVAGLLADGEPGERELARASAVVAQLGGPTDEAETAPLYSPLDIAIPQEVLLVLGISVASLAGAGVIKSNRAANEDGRATQILESRADRALEAASQAGAQVTALETTRDTLEALGGPEALGDPAAEERARLAEERLAELEPRLRAAEAAAIRAEARAQEQAVELQLIQAEAVGELHANATAADARWSDMVRGDTVANFSFADLGKIQMFLFTVITVFAYAALVWSLMSMPAAGAVIQAVPSLSLPAFSDSVVLTLAISHGGYLATKTAA
jgi:hypothetical protein